MESCTRRLNRRKKRLMAPSPLRRSEGVYLSDHLAAGLGSLTVGGPFASECKDSLPGGAIFKGELADDAAESRHLDVPDRWGGLTQEQQEGVEPVVERE